MSNQDNGLEKRFKSSIVFVSILIPIVVAILFSIKLKDFGINVEPLSFLPPIYAGINALTAILLVIGVIAIKNGNREKHQKLMTAAIGCSVAFLVMYVAYHLTADSAKYGDTNHDGIVSEVELAEAGIMRLIYFFILITHILLSIIIIPLVLFTYVRALAERFDRHKKLAKITFPIWLYVAITGVIVYIMISPYYAN
ncbi:DUF420 domain-containing protein [Flavobacterium solisilvae]|uniref:DUF420 domain-containing protein n=1 Tax=Flavobacterium solisilvae TaxID=1852019 RepID=A0ABX1QP37_9FLAO|nr:DUF420 domain-containing protein [Flavobacterium solisilvae]NMH23916.1 DUF420 domain-containing protein [Flavobacterium solisilvae]